MPPDSTLELTIPAALAARVQAVAADEHRPAAEIVCEALEHYLQERQDHAAPPSTQPARPSPAEALARMQARRANTPLPEGMTIRDMIDYGRR